MTSVLFEPTTIRGMELANRFVRSATWEGMADEEGRATPGLVGMYRDLAEGKVGLDNQQPRVREPGGPGGDAAIGSA